MYRTSPLSICVPLFLNWILCIYKERVKHEGGSALDWLERGAGAVEGRPSIAVVFARPTTTVQQLRTAAFVGQPDCI